MKLAGELRLVLTDEQPLAEGVKRRDSAMKWISGKVVSPLINVPVEMNLRTIYSELGLYDRERLGTPCDDL